MFIFLLFILCDPHTSVFPIVVFKVETIIYKNVKKKNQNSRLRMISNLVIAVFYKPYKTKNKAVGQPQSVALYDFGLVGCREQQSL